MVCRLASPCGRGLSSRRYVCMYVELLIEELDRHGRTVPCWVDREKSTVDLVRERSTAESLIQLGSTSLYHTLPSSCWEVPAVSFYTIHRHTHRHTNTYRHIPTHRHKQIYDTATYLVTDSWVNKTPRKHRVSDGQHQKDLEHTNWQLQLYSQCTASHDC